MAEVERYPGLLKVSKVDNNWLIDEEDSERGFRRTKIDENHNITVISTVPLDDPTFKYIPSKGIRSRI